MQNIRNENSGKNRYIHQVKEQTIAKLIIKRKTNMIEMTYKKCGFISETFKFKKLKREK